MFHVGQKVTPPKWFARLSFRTLRNGTLARRFLTGEQDSGLAKACAAAGPWMRALLEVGYTYGWRLRN
jgi:hypothetical protein